MNVEDFRNHCLSLPGVTEKMPWAKQRKYESTLVFSIGSKWFTFVDIDKFEFCNLKCDPTRSEELRAHYDGITPGWHMNHKHWISVYFQKDVPDTLISQLIDESYHNVFNTLPAKEREKIINRNNTSSEETEK